MTDGGKDKNSSESAVVKIILSILALLGLAIPAAFANWDKIFSKSDQPVSKPSMTVSPPPSSSPISSPPSPSQSFSGNKPESPNKLDNKIDGCREQLLSKLGRYEGESVIINSSTRRSGKVVIDINREADDSCRLIARVEEFSPLAGKGTLTGQFDPNVGQKVALMGSLSHQTQPKIWDVEMSIQFINKNSIEGQSTWKPKSGVEDSKIYYEEFTATKL